jgi:hypothetical protein
MADENTLSIKQLLPSRFNTLARGKTYVGIDFCASTKVVYIVSMQRDGITIETKPLN